MHNELSQKASRFSGSCGQYNLRPTPPESCRDSKSFAFHPGKRVEIRLSSKEPAIQIPSLSLSIRIKRLKNQTMKTLLNPCPGFFPSLFRFNQTTRLENRYGSEHDIHLFSSLSRPDQPKDLKTKCFVRVVLPQIPSLYPSERYKDLKRTIMCDIMFAWKAS